MKVLVASVLKEIVLFWDARWNGTVPMLSSKGPACFESGGWMVSGVEDTLLCVLSSCPLFFSQLSFYSISYCLCPLIETFKMWMEGKGREGRQRATPESRRKLAALLGQWSCGSTSTLWGRGGLCGLADSSSLCSLMHTQPLKATFPLPPKRHHTFKTHKR